MKHLMTLLMVLCSSSVFAAGDVAAGKVAAAVCASCHGANGYASIPGYPNLAGQQEAYLVNSMKAYKTGERTGALATIMKLQMQVLNEQDINNLAAYYAQLK